MGDGVGVVVVDDVTPANRLGINANRQAAIQNPPNLDVALSTLATETKLEAVRVILASLDGKDFATQTTLATLLTESGFATKVGEVSASPTSNTLLARLKDVYDGVVARLGTLGQKAMVASTPVAVASDQTTIPVTQRDADDNPIDSALSYQYRAQHTADLENRELLTGILLELKHIRFHLSIMTEENGLDEEDVTDDNN